MNDSIHRLMQLAEYLRRQGAPGYVALLNEDIIPELEKLQNSKAKALDLATSYGQIDGSHHKAWTIDQMVRALTNCPLVEVKLVDIKGASFTYEKQAESEEYKALVKQYEYGYPLEIQNGEVDGEEQQYVWDQGIPP